MVCLANQSCSDFICDIAGIGSAVLHSERRWSRRGIGTSTNGQHLHESAQVTRLQRFDGAQI